MASGATLPFKISVLVFLQDGTGRLLLIQRTKAPNQGCWSPPGGKLEMAQGESPFECAVREVWEETNFKITASDLHLFGMVSEKGYEGQNHWLMFLFRCRKPITQLPATIDEGHFTFFSRKEIETIAVPASDRILLWPIWDQYRDSFIAYRAECDPQQPLQMVIEENHRQPNLD